MIVVLISLLTLTDSRAAITTLHTLSISEAALNLIETTNMRETTTTNMREITNMRETCVLSNSILPTIARGFLPILEDNLCGRKGITPLLLHLDIKLTALEPHAAMICARRAGLGTKRCSRVVRVKS